ncbi:unnamed protein product [Prunus armeniaca]
MATADETPSAPIVPPTAKVASTKPPRAWRPRQDGDPRGMVAVSLELKAAALEGADEGIIDVYHGRNPPFSANETPRQKGSSLPTNLTRPLRPYTRRTERPGQEGCQVTNPSRENWRSRPPSAEAIWNTSADILL